MQFDMKRSLGAGAAADADPRTDPADVLDAALLKCPLTLRNSDTIPTRMLFAVEGTALNTVVVNVWALDDTGLDRLASLPARPDQAGKAAREFYLVGAVTATVGELNELVATDSMPGPGTVYVQVTTGPAAAAVLKVVCA